MFSTGEVGTDARSIQERERAFRVLNRVASELDTAREDLANEKSRADRAERQGQLNRELLERAASGGGSAVATRGGCGGCGRRGRWRCWNSAAPFSAELLSENNRFES